MHFVCSAFPHITRSPPRGHLPANVLYTTDPSFQRGRHWSSESFLQVYYRQVSFCTGLKPPSHHFLFFLKTKYEQDKSAKLLLTFSQQIKQNSRVFHSPPPLWMNCECSINKNNNTMVLLSFERRSKESTSQPTTSIVSFTREWKRNVNETIIRVNTAPLRRHPAIGKNRRNLRWTRGFSRS